MNSADLRHLLSGSRLPALEWRMLWCHVLGVSHSWLLAHDDTVPDADQLSCYQSLEARRLAGEPMAYILGYRAFMGHCFVVTPDVLIPRPETELLVELAVQHADRQMAAASRLVASAASRLAGSSVSNGDDSASVPVQILDLGTGSGAVAISMALARPGMAVTATDISDAALAVARRNATALGAKVEFFSGNWYHALPEGKVFDVIVSNPPYIAASDTHLEQGDLRFEPRQALTDGGMGLQALGKIIADAPAHLREGGSLLVEHGWDQAAAVAQQFQQAGFRQIFSQKDLAGIPRVTGGFLSFFMDQS